jgi:hypothetical protein
LLLLLWTTRSVPRRRLHLYRERGRDIKDEYNNIKTPPNDVISLFLTRPAVKKLFTVPYFDAAAGVHVYLMLYLFVPFVSISSSEP